MNDMNRRVGDNAQKSKIMELIEVEDDPKTRALLLVLNSINESLLENTRSTMAVAGQLELHITAFKAHRDDFAQHITDEMALANQVKGGSKVAKYVVNAIRVITVVLCAWIVQDIEAIHSDLRADQLDHVNFKDRLQTLESKK